MLTEPQLRHAVRANPGQARALGWDKWLAEIGALLGEPSAGAGEARLAHKVERFQSGHPPLAKDGVIGSGTWLVLKKAIDDKPARISNPNAPPPKDSKPTPDRVKALSDWLLAITEGHPRSTNPWTYYEEIDKYLGPFGDTGYPIAYGKKYCVLFNTNDTLSRDARAKAWVHRTTILLQTYLSQYIVERYQKGTLASVAEKALREAAFASHPLAYTRGGLTLIVMQSPGLMSMISSIPAAEFSNENADSSMAQYVETRNLVIKEVIGTLAAGMAGPAHTGALTRAADKDRLEFQRRIQLGEYLTDLKKGIDSGRIERIAWLDRVTKQLDGIEFPDAALKKLAGDIVTRRR
jgi:hypothetical protein